MTPSSTHHADHSHSSSHTNTNNNLRNNNNNNNNDDDYYSRNNHYNYNYNTFPPAPLRSHHHLLPQSPPMATSSLPLSPPLVSSSASASASTSSSSSAGYHPSSYRKYLPDARRIRTFLFRLPLATRGLLLVIWLFYAANLYWGPRLHVWGALIPDRVGLGTLYRLNTFPLIHKTFFHLILNLVTLLPLLERFESEHGTITTFVLFTGPFGLIPGLMYTFLERYIFHLNTGVVGSSIWVFLLLANESIKLSKSNPEFILGGFGIPTWLTPLFGILLVWFLVPGTSLLGHLCGATVGYLWGMGWLRFLAPHDKILRWVEGKLNLLGRLPHYVSVDQKTYGRYGVLPSTRNVGPGVGTLGALEDGRGVSGIAIGPQGSTQRLGP